MKHVVAILDTMWGSASGDAPPFFKINPENHSGRRKAEEVFPDFSVEGRRLWPGSLEAAAAMLGSPTAGAAKEGGE